MYVKPFRFWCQKVIPLVYDDSLSYYEVLCKVVNYINKLIEDGVIFGEQLEAIKEDFEQFKEDTENSIELIQEYIDNLIVKNPNNNLYKNLELFTDDGVLTVYNFKAAVNRGLEEGYNHFFIPAGTYDINWQSQEEFDNYGWYFENKELHFQCDKNTYFNLTSPDQSYRRYVIMVLNSSHTPFSWYGGKFSCTGYMNEIYSNLHQLKTKYIYGIYLRKARYAIIENVSFENFWGNSCIYFNESRHVKVSNCDFRHFTSRGVAFADDCIDFTVEDCTFYDIHKFVDADGYFCDYCHAVWNDVIDGTVERAPSQGLIYRNNYVANSADCALDTHGCKDVLIENNIIINTVNAITAYNDHNRKIRPLGWNMTNIIIRNNYCSSNREPESKGYDSDARIYPALPYINDSSYPHPFVFLGCTKYAIFSENDNYPFSDVDYNQFVNVTVENNYFSTPNKFTYDNGFREAVIFLDRLSKNVRIINNEIRCLNNQQAFNLYNTLNFTVENNIFVGNRFVRPYHSYGSFRNNINTKIDRTATFSCLDTDTYYDGMKSVGTLITPIAIGGKYYPLSIGSSNAELACVNTVGRVAFVNSKLEQEAVDALDKYGTNYGNGIPCNFIYDTTRCICVIDESIYNTLNTTRGDFVMYLPIPRLALQYSADGNTWTNCYCGELLSDNKFTIINSIFTPINISGNGFYRIRRATSYRKITTETVQET